MTLPHPTRWFAPLLFTLLTACGGGGTTEVAGGGIGGTGISSGPITDVGTVAAASLGGGVAVFAVGAPAVTVTTITVNRVVFELSGTTTVTLNRQAAVAGDLRIGQVVRVVFTGDPTTGPVAAVAVTYDPNLTAPVEEVDVVGGGRVRILGQWVAVDTLLDADDEEGMPMNLSDLSLHDLLEVSGERDADGLLHATRIERKKRNADSTTTPVEVEVEGQVVGLAEDPLRFTLHGLTVVVPQDLAIDGTLAEGVDVDVEGSLSGATLTASHIEVKGSPVADQEQDSRVELEGFITAVDRLATDDEIEVGGVVVRLTKTTEILGDEESAATRDDLLLNVEVEIEGTVDGAGGVVAERISLDG